VPIKPLSWALRPFSTYRNRRSTEHGLCLPAKFRLQGLGTLLTAYALRSRAGLLSSRQRSWDFSLRSIPLPQGIAPFPTPMNLPAVSPAVVSRCSNTEVPRHRTGPTGRSSQALTLARVPGEPNPIKASIRWMLPWDSPLPGYARRNLGGKLSPPPPLACLPSRSNRIRHVDESDVHDGLTPQSLDRPRPGPILSPRASPQRRASGDPHRVFVPTRNPAHFSENLSRAMGSPFAPPCVAASCGRS